MIDQPTRIVQRHVAAGPAGDRRRDLLGVDTERPGIYLARLTVDGQALVRRLALIP